MKHVFKPWFRFLLIYLVFIDPSGPNPIHASQVVKKDIIECSEAENEGEMEDEPDGVMCQGEFEEGSEMGTTLVFGENGSADENDSSQESELPPLQPAEELYSKDTPSSPEVVFGGDEEEIPASQPLNDEEIPASQVPGSPQSSLSESPSERSTPDRTTGSHLHEELFSTPPETDKSDYRREEVVEMRISLMEFFGKEHPDILKNLDLLFGGNHAFDDLLFCTPKQFMI